MPKMRFYHRSIKGCTSIFAGLPSESQEFAGW
jgi:hypothetical protein